MAFPSSGSLKPVSCFHYLEGYAAFLSYAIHNFWLYLLVGQWKLKSSVMRTPIQPLTWLVVAFAGRVQRDQQAAIVYLLAENRVLKA